MPSAAYKLFQSRRVLEVRDLARIFDTGNARRGPNSHHSLLNGGLVLLISSWEYFNEELCREVCAKICSEGGGHSFADLSDTVKRELLIFAANEEKPHGDPLRQRLHLLTGSRWKELYHDRVDSYLRDFNTPRFHRDRGKNLNELYRRCLGYKISEKIDEFLGEPGFCARLDEIVTLRGEIAHTGGPGPENKLNSGMLRRHVDRFAEAAALCEYLVYSDFRQHFGYAPWQLTSSIKQAVRPEKRTALN